MDLELNHLVVYCTASLASTKSIGTCYSLPFVFSKIVLEAQFIVPKNKRYNILIVTKLFKDFKGNVNHQEGFVSLLGYRVTLAPAKLLVTKGLQNRCSYLLDYVTKILSLDYHVTQTKFQLPLYCVEGEEDILIYPTAKDIIPANS